MAITYFQDTIFNTFDTLSAPGGTDSLQVAVNNTFSTRTYSLFVTVASKNNSVVISIIFRHIFTIIIIICSKK